nr:hypothetical protein Iba_chr14cCG5640 [Ipomoea batatas]
MNVEPSLEEIAAMVGWNEALASFTRQDRNNYPELPPCNDFRKIDEFHDGLVKRLAGNWEIRNVTQKPPPTPDFTIPKVQTIAKQPFDELSCVYVLQQRKYIRPTKQLADATDASDKNGMTLTRNHTINSSTSGGPINLIGSISRHSYESRRFEQDNNQELHADSFAISEAPVFNTKATADCRNRQEPSRHADE